MEAGQSPARSRHCVEGADSTMPLQLGFLICVTNMGFPFIFPMNCEKADEVLISKSGDMHKCNYTIASRKTQ